MFGNHQLISYLKLMASQGIESKEVFDFSGVGEASFQNPYGCVSREQGARFIDALANLLPGDFPLRHGAQTKHLDFGVVGHAALSCRTLEQSMMVWSRYSAAIGHPLQIETGFASDFWVYEMYPRFPLSQKALGFVLQDAIASHAPLGRAISNLEISAVEYQVAVPREVFAPNYADWLDAPVRFSCSHNRILMDKSFQLAEIETADELVLKMCEQQCSELLDSLSSADSLSQSVKRVLLASSGIPPSIDEIANRLGTSKRTLSRRLEEEGTTYSDVLNEFRRDYSMELLRENLLHVKEISYVVGFKSVNSFRRAFKEWTGLSIGDWQARNR